MSFNFDKKGIPVAVLYSKDSPFNQRVLYFEDTIIIDGELIDDSDELRCKYCGLDFARKVTLQNHLKFACRKLRLQKEVDNYIRKNKIQDLSLYLKNNNKEVILFGGETLQILPQIPELSTTNSGSSVFLCGPPGAGKSVWIANFAIEFIKMYPDYKIIVFSRHESDQAFQSIGTKIYRIPLDQELVDNPVDSADLKKALVILDDIESADRNVTKYMLSLRNDLCKNYREHAKGQGHTFLLNALQSGGTDGVETKKLIQCSTAYVIFPKYGKGQYDRLLSVYLHLDKATIEKIYKLNSRWVYINRVPLVIYHEHGAFII